MKRIKTTFNTYSKLGKPTQSLINFLMNHGSIYFLMVTDVNDENSFKNLYDGNETVELHEGNSYTVTFDSTETIEDNTEVVVHGWLYHSDQDETEYEFKDKYTITNNSFTVKVPADKDDNYDRVYLVYVRTLPVITHLTGAIRLDNVNEESGYDITIPYCNLSNYSPSGLPAMTPSATNGRMNIRFVAKTNNDLVIKIVYDEEHSNNSNTAYANIQLFHSLEDTSPFAVTTNPVDLLSSTTVAQVYNLPITLAENDNGDSYLSDYVKVEVNSQKYVTSYDPVRFDVTPDDPVIILELKAITDTNSYLSYFNSFYGYDTPDSLTSDSFLQVFKLNTSYDYNSSDVLIVGNKLNTPLSAPANIALEPSSTNIQENIPYSVFEFETHQIGYIPNVYYGKLKLAKNTNAQIDYQLRSTSFTIKYVIYNGIEYYLYSRDVYYKIGVCPLDGTTKTRDSLTNDLKHYAFSIKVLNSSSNGPEISFNIQSPIWYENQYTFGELGSYGKTNVYVKDIANLMRDNYTIGLCNNAIIPILNSEATELLGFMYIQLCNTNGSDFDEVNLLSTATGNYISPVNIEVNKVATENPIDGELLPSEPDYGSDKINYMGLIDHDIDGGFIPSVSDTIIQM